MITADQLATQQERIVAAVRMWNRLSDADESGPAVREAFHAARELVRRFSRGDGVSAVNLVSRRRGRRQWADVIRFAAAIGKAIRMTKAMCARDSAPTATTPCADCAADIEALRALAALLEKAERVPEYLGEMNPSGAAEIVRRLAAGYTPEGKG